MKRTLLLVALFLCTFVLGLVAGSNYIVPQPVIAAAAAPDHHQAPAAAPRPLASALRTGGSP